MRSFAAFGRAAHTRARGRIAEKEARRWLEREGFEIVAVNFATKVAEIDVVAREGETLCFIEVKARTGTGFGSAAEAVPPRKQLRIARAASLFLARSGWDGPCRFDVLAMDGNREEWRFDLVRDAFHVEG